MSEAPARPAASGVAALLEGDWSKYFEIVEIVPGYIGNHQDLGVMRRTS